MSIQQEISEQLAHWTRAVRFQDLPESVVQNTKYRVLDVIGLALAGVTTPYGASLKQASSEMNPPGPSRLFGIGQRVPVAAAAFVNGALSQAMEFDDTHNESIVHMSSPAVAAALALAEAEGLSGKEVITAIAIGNEISCRVGSVAPGQFHRRGFHPTGLFAPFGATYLAGRVLGLSSQQLVNAAGIVGSFAAGLLECWVDGTQSKFLHPGWAAQSGITAAYLGRAGNTGPTAVFDGRFGLFASHLQDKSVALDLGRITDDLGRHWESERASFKPYPAAHVIHPYLDALLRLRAQHRIDPEQVQEIVVPVAGFIVGIVCEPLSEKRRPNTDSHGRVSMQYSLAEAMARGELGRHAYQPDSLKDPRILRLADAVTYRVDPDFPGPERFKGAVQVIMRDGTVYETAEDHNRGSAENPMTHAELVGKFETNAEDLLGASRRHDLIDAVMSLDKLPAASRLVDLAISEARA
jgi:2-methylcitrate dehydratase PrpD